MKLLDNRQLDQRNLQPLRAPSSDLVEPLLRRATFLAKDDQVLIELSVRSQLPYRRISTLMGIPAGTVSRRLRRLGRLLRDPMIVRLLDGPCPLDREDRQIAIGYFLRRQSLRDLSLLHRQTPAQITKRLHFVRGWFRGATLAPRERPQIE